MPKKRLDGTDAIARPGNAHCTVYDRYKMSGCSNEEISLGITRRSACLINGIGGGAFVREESSDAGFKMKTLNNKPVDSYINLSSGKWLHVKVDIGY